MRRNRETETTAIGGAPRDGQVKGPRRALIEARNGAITQTPIAETPVVPNIVARGILVMAPEQAEAVSAELRDIATRDLSPRLTIQQPKRHGKRGDK